MVRVGGRLGCFGEVGGAGCGRPGGATVNACCSCQFVLLHAVRFVIVCEQNVRGWHADTEDTELVGVTASELPPRCPSRSIHVTHKYFMLASLPLADDECRSRRVHHDPIWTPRERGQRDELLHLRSHVLVHAHRLVCRHIQSAHVYRCWSHSILGTFWVAGDGSGWRANGLTGLTWKLLFYVNIRVFSKKNIPHTHLECSLSDLFVGHLLCSHLP